MGKQKAQKIVLNRYGSFLGVQKGCFVLKAKNGDTTIYPLFEREIGEVVLKSGNMVSTGALATMGFWGIDCLIMTRKGRPVAMLKSLDDDSHVKTRLCQYEAINNEKGVHIAKQFVLGKFDGQNTILRKYDLTIHDSTYKEKVETLNSSWLNPTLRRRLMAYESKFTKHYFNQIFSLFPEKIRPIRRRTFKAYDGTNNSARAAGDISRNFPLFL